MSSVFTRTSRPVWGALAPAILVLFSISAEAEESYSPQTSPQAALGSSGGNLRISSPDIGFNALFSAAQYNVADPIVFEGGHDPKVNGFSIQNVELALGAAVDPYFRGDANIVVVPEDGETKVELEEVYLTSLDFPWNLQLKAGTFFTAFGRMNPTHPHAWDFVNKPLVNGRMFGGDGLRNPGAQLSWLSPLPWFSELMVSLQNSTGETATSFRPEGTMRGFHEGVAMARWNNFNEISERISFNWGGSFLTGPNAETDERRQTKIAGVDLYLRYRRPNSLSFIALQVEGMKRFYETADRDLEDSGAYAQLIYRLGEPWQRWHVGLRYDWVGPKDEGSPNTSPGEVDPVTGEPIDRDLARRFRVSPVVTFYPSEFSKFRLQYDYDRPSGGKTQQMVALQWEFLMGAHGVHKF